MDKKILFLDLDGTLLNDSREISKVNREALSLALSKGHRVVIATGRPLRSAIKKSAELSLNDKGCFVIAFNGGVIYDFEREAILSKSTLSLDTLKKIFDEAKRRGLHIQTYDSRDVLVESRCDDKEIRYYCDYIQMSYRVFEDMYRDFDEPPIKALLIDLNTQRYLKEFESWLNENLADKMDCFFSQKEFLEIVPKGMSKSIAVLRLCELLGINVKQSVAVGDGPNDISMLKSVGLGVAMQNASEEVKACADYVTQNDNNHHGVAEVVDRFLL
ncbi:MAG: Cof-type HAD-IIB family hydrolase [Ruminococcus sp.]